MVQLYAMSRKLINVIFILTVLIALCAGLVRTVVAPVDISEYENRYAEKIGKPLPGNYMAGLFQDSVELALADQLFYAEDAKREYNTRTAAFKTAVLRAVMARDVKQQEEIEAKPATEDLPEETVWHEAENGSDPALKKASREISARLYSFDEKIYRLSGSMLLCRDHLLYTPRVLSNHTKNIDRWLQRTNEYIASYPDLDFYVYYIEKETDIDFSTMRRVWINNYVRDGLDLPDDRFGCFAVTNFDDFDEWFFKTDHHWNYKGSYRGYRQVLKLLLPKDAPLEPTGEYEIGVFSGTKAQGSDTEVYKEMFSAYSFDFPQIKTTENGAARNYYGGSDYYIEKAKAAPGSVSGLTYGKFYGQDSGEIIFENPDSPNGNILVLGESYDNAILRLLACHFTKLCSVDLRNYRAQTGKIFDFDSYVREHGITKVLLIGNVDYFTVEAFLIR